ncbi:elongation factor G [Bifidobacterium simiarum]|uniref:elongation factor G n=1 Tax=Bifidobacterium simiarum TaxID=2045441 RepID=UPI001BDD019F|nr:TetM/TetW/TetO/TetS family tetracycline resistance ribosomal protection protein [Bifidobacterium simiarum]MBT1165378.1 TetM/TetW/TetO/TetS family tetracycline resistance ribosomal protection protein [Bifidobacterium simiarum]
MSEAVRLGNGETKRIVAGILAHVDAGKTTLSEAMLYRSGELRRLGRVDHGDAFLDTDAMERRRGITIFSHQARIDHGDLRLTLLDTPGHVDFAAETERTLRVLDYAILVVSGADGVQGHTETLWRLLARYRVPTMIFVNKMDTPGADRETLLDRMRRRLSDGCADFTPLVAGRDLGDMDDAGAMADASALTESQWEALAMQDERATDEFLEHGRLTDGRLRAMIADRQVFPCFFGSALRLDGVDDLLDGLARFTREPDRSGQFGARAYKISHDERHHRLTWMKITGGALRAKETIGRPPEKADQIRVYNGAKFLTVDEVPAGSVCAVAGPVHTFPGEGLGCEADAEDPSLQPVLTYTLLPGDNDIHRCLDALRELEDEDPLLHVTWQERLGEIHLQLMGSIQLEIIQQMLHDRFGLDVTFGPGSILYKETITAPVEGVGHFEPLRHYAEAHLLLEPTGPNTGLSFATSCSLDVLDRNWQRLILTHLREREHLGVLTGSPITDMRITLLTGRAHLKHTEGGDFRQATYRAVRQGLMMAARGIVGHPQGDLPAQPLPDAEHQGNCRLLEPWYRFRLEVPDSMIGRAMSDIQRMSGQFDSPATDDGYATLEGRAPVSEMRDYAMDVNAYTHGMGRLTCTFAGYEPCHDAEAVIERIGYDPTDDPEHTPDSVFCAHGAGYKVDWNEVPSHMHLGYASDGPTEE